MRIQDVLDDAVYALAALTRSRRRFGGEALLASWAEQYSLEIYRRPVGLATLEAAWSLRKLDVLTLRRLQQTFDGPPEDPDAFLQHVRFSHRTQLDAAFRAEIALILAAAESTPEAFRVFVDHHSAEVRRRGGRIVEVRVAPRDPLAISMETLVHLQEDGLARLAERSVVIETLPSSNVRIGGYKDASEHHLLRWLGVTPGLEIRPRVALGSDDPGIFSTQIANEFAHVHMALAAHPGVDVMRHLRRLNRTGREVRFRSPPVS